MRKTRFRHVGAPKGSSPHQRKKIILNVLFLNQNQLCYWCNKPIFLCRKREKSKPDTATIDHVRPRSLGGTDNLENLVAACYKCNSEKGCKIWKK